MATSRTRLLAATIIATTAVATALAGCAKKDTGSTTGDGVKLVKKDVLTVCTHLPYPPFQFKDDSGKTVGFDVSLMDLVAKKLNLRQEIVDTPFEGIKSGQDLKSGKCDVAAAGMTINEDRKKVLDFSDPYFDATQALLAATGKPYKKLEDLKGKKVGVQGGTTGEEYIKGKAAAAGFEPISYKDLAAEQQALATGQIEAAVNDYPVWTDYIKKNPGKFEITANFNTGEQYGFAVAKGGNDKLKTTINEVIKAAKDDKTYDKLYEQWIGAKPTTS